jgi:hypothetical protein
MLQLGAGCCFGHHMQAKLGGFCAVLKFAQLNTENRFAQHGGNNGVSHFAMATNTRLAHRSAVAEEGTVSIDCSHNLLHTRQLCWQVAE